MWRRQYARTWLIRAPGGSSLDTTIISPSTTNSFAKGQLMSELSYEGTLCLLSPSLQPLIPRPACTDSWKVHPDYCLGQTAYKCSQDEIMLTTYWEPIQGRSPWSETKIPQKSFYITSSAASIPQHSPIILLYFLHVFVTIWRYLSLQLTLEQHRFDKII